jgi:hypothetical protein
MRVIRTYLKGIGPIKSIKKPGSTGRNERDSDGLTDKEISDAMVNIFISRC